jgi:hypothetical protein
MGDLISRAKALDALHAARVRVMGMRVGKTILSEYARQCRDAMIEAIATVPDEDAEYVRHGFWIPCGKTKKGSSILKCSSCGMIRKGVSKTTYCRDCGAKMDLPMVTDEELDEFVALALTEPNYIIDNEETFEQDSYWPKENPFLHT